jgi:cell division protein FtsZ
LFGAEEATAAPAPTTTRAAEKQQVKKAPSLFERFSLRDKPAAAAPVKAEAGVRLSVEEGGKSDGGEDLDIPAFLRRQAN